jgi:predicted MFS family arabinose efflux permease
MISALRQRDFALLWTGGLISLTGDWILLAALPFYIYGRTGSALATSGTFAVMGLPWLLFGSVAGVFVDRWDRRRTMIACDGVRTVLLLGLLLVPATGALWPVYVVTFLETSIGTLFGPARNALVPAVVPEERLTAANSLRAASDNLARLAGPPIGGLLLVAIGFSGAIVADSLSYLGSAVAITLMRVSRRTEPEAEVAEVGSALRAVWSDWHEGLRAVVGDRLLTALFVAVGAAMLADSLLSGALVPFIKNVVHTDARGFGWLMTCRGLGGLIGSLIIGYLAFMRPGRMLSTSLAALGLIVLAATVFRPLPAEMVLMGLAGVPAIGWMVAEQTILQTRVEDRLRGRVFATYMTTSAVLATGGLILAGALVGVVGTITVIYMTAGLYLAAGAIGLLMILREEHGSATAAALEEGAAEAQPA